MRMFFLVLLLQGSCLHAQFSDSFLDGDFSGDPEWIGTSELFTVDLDQPALRLAAPAVAGEASLFTASQSMEEAVWQFSFRMGFNPSSANYTRVYLAGDAINMAQLQRAFYLVLGSSADNISLWQVRNGQHELLINGLAGRLNRSTPEGEIKVTRHKGGEMILETKMEEDWMKEGRVDGTEGFATGWFGLSCHYTATRSTLFWFSDFWVEGAAFTDTIPSRVVRYEVVDARTVRIGFSREIRAETFDGSSFYWLADGPAIASVSWRDDLTVDVCLAEDYPNGRLMVAGLQSVLGANGAPLEDAEFTLYFYKTQRYDLVFSEVMAQPTSSMELPESPYVELYNRSVQPVNVAGFTLTIGSKKAVLADYVLFPGDYLLLLPGGHADAWSQVENKLEVSGWPTLPVAGAEVVLWDNFGDVVAALHYHREMGQEGFKRDGGWSLEVRDVHHLSGDPSNWDYSSELNGGTPGRENSLSSSFPDVVAPSMESVYLRGDSCLVLQFTEPLDAGFLDELDNSWFSPAGLTVQSSRLSEPFRSGLEVCFTDKIPVNIGFSMNFGHLPEDLAGNRFLMGSPVRFALPVAAQPFEVVINELLFDPPEGGADFVELYNRSDKHLDLSGLYVSRSNEAGIPETLVPVSGEKRALFPGDYLVLTGDKDWLMKTFIVPEERAVLLLAGMPNYVNAGGTVVLSDHKATVIDALSYSEAMHYQLLSTTKGVSLERIDAHAETQQVYNWHSASADEGYATPGRKNSQSLSPSVVLPDDFIHLEPDVFSPNQDGTDDLLRIHYVFEKPGYSCSVTIYNRAGQPVRYLVNNELAGTSGFYTWDGLNEQNARCATGIYVVLVRCFHPSGEVKEVKKVTVLSSN
ncbi:MAG: lamin tail domain-containing protein [Bacteroidales bacterium]|nr:lamin tail domain-containing protein [Bacteroidales bacterium]